MRLPRATIEQIGSLHDQGLSVRMIAAETGVHRASVHRAIRQLRAEAEAAARLQVEERLRSSRRDSVIGWPPPADRSTVWRRRQLRRAGQVVQVREVELWGRAVEVDEAGRVLCPCCVSLLSLEELARPGNAHPVGILGWSGRLVPLPEDDYSWPEPRSPRW